MKQGGCRTCRPFSIAEYSLEDIRSSKRGNGLSVPDVIVSRKEMIQDKGMKDTEELWGTRG